MDSQNECSDITPDPIINLGADKIINFIPPRNY